MKNLDRIVALTYLSLTAMIMLFTTLYALEPPAQYLKFAVRLAMLATVIALHKSEKSQYLLIPAFFCTVISDYFFVYLRAVNPGLVNRELYGMLGFVLAYLFLIMAFQSKGRLGKSERFTLLPFVLIFGVVLALLAKYAVGFMFWAAVFLGVVLCYAGMTMVSALYRGKFSRKVAWRIAIAGCVLFLSDMVVAFSIFHPDYKGFILWKENLIWGTYMLGWALLLSVAAEERLLARS